MTPRLTFRSAVVVFAVLLVATSAAATAQEVRPLDHDAYAIWHDIEDTTLSDDGAWVAYRLTLQNGDAEMVVRATAGGVEHRVARGGDLRFTAGASHAVMLIAPTMAETRQARLDKVPDAQRPKAQLAILDLGTGQVTRFERVRSFDLGTDDGSWLAFLLEADAAAADEAEVEGEQPAAATPEATDSPDDAPSKPAGTTLVILDLPTAVEHRIENVVEFLPARDGAALVYATSTADGSADGVYLWRPGGDSPVALAEGSGHYKHLAIDDAGDRVAFLSDRETFGTESAEYALWWARGGNQATKLADSATASLADNWWVSEHAEPSFSPAGRRLFFGTAPRPATEPESDPMLDEERVRVDIWHWQDELLQPNQLLQVDDEERRSYLAVALPDTGVVVQLADPTMPDVELLDDGDVDVAHGVSDLPYRMERSWDSPGRNDHYRVDVDSGARTLIRAGQRGAVNLSPDGRWFAWWDDTELAWFVRDVSANEAPATNVTAVLRQPVHNEDHDWAFEPQPYGIAGWTRVPEAARRQGAADTEIVIYDRFDLWALDPAGVAAPRHVTSGAGRDDELMLRYVDLDPENDWMESETLLLSGFDRRDKDAGFWSVDTFATRPPQELLRDAKRFSRPRKARRAGTLVYTREDVAEFPDVWVSDTAFTTPQRLSEANPQQSEYNWATAELTQWRSLDGEVLQGLIHKPADFDPSRKYPMMVTFYERNADNLHNHFAPVPHRSVIQQTFYASRGYVVFTPDITYQVGYPGESALKDIVSGVLHMIDLGYVDANNIGTQGHSWGGYQIAYLVTKSNIFKAAAGGAPVANMTSAYGGIRWGSGLSRMFQYEKTQSRIGATLWEAPLRYLENSPLFWADKVETPLMMMHNDHDGAVPWYQGIEMFVALRRLGKPAWLINYNDEPHWPTTYANKVDWNIRMQQFFDHYLKGAPAPVWLVEGIPAVDKGKTLGLELIDQNR